MSSIQDEAQPATQPPVQADKKSWLAPEFTRLEAGNAEAGDGTGTDSSGFLS
jgi:hypothetical protein